MSYYKKRNGNYGGKRRGRGGRRNGRYSYSRTPNFTYWNVLDKVKGDVAKLKGLINTEFKKKDTFSTLDIDNVTPRIRVINALAVGDDFDEREGREVRIKSIQVTLTLFLNPLSTQTFVRCIVVLDLQPNGIGLVIGDLLSDTATELGSTNFRNLDFRKRFVILKDEVVMLQASGQRTAHIEWYKQMNMHTTYNSLTTGGISDITTNALYIILYSGEATDGVVNTCRTRVRFIDN